MKGSQKLEMSTTASDDDLLEQVLYAYEVGWLSLFHHLITKLQLLSKSIGLQGSDYGQNILLPIALTNLFR